MPTVSFRNFRAFFVELPVQRLLGMDPDGGLCDDDAVRACAGVGRGHAHLETTRASWREVA
jgi:hypothetical protein